MIPGRYCAYVHVMMHSLPQSLCFGGHMCRSVKAISSLSICAQPPLTRMANNRGANEADYVWRCSDCLPGYLSSTTQSRDEPDVKRRRSENAQLHETVQQSRAAYEAEEANNKLQSLEDTSSRFRRFHRNAFWTNVYCDNCIIFAYLEPTTQAPELLASVTVSADLRVCVFWKHVQLASNEEIDIPGQVLDFCLLENLLDSVPNYCKKRSHQKNEQSECSARNGCSSSSWSANAVSANGKEMRVGTQLNYWFSLLCCTQFCPIHITFSEVVARCYCQVKQKLSEFALLKVWVHQRSQLKKVSWGSWKDELFC